MNDLISIVIPFYNGNKHLQNLKETIDANYTDLGSIARLEVILVNDSPWESVNLSVFDGAKYNVTCVNHEKNMGIHKARITGIENASGNYIFMLDQDDQVTPDCIKSLYSCFSEDIDVVYGNGVFETDNGPKLILNNYCRAVAAKDNRFYMYLGNLLSSPGQCLIRKSAIPQYWMKNVIKSNCADDLFLWCLLMKKNNARYCNKIVYIHKNTGVNFSLDKENGYNSDREVLAYLKKANCLDERQLKIFETRCTRNIDRLNKNKLSFSCELYSGFELLLKIAMLLISSAYKIRGKRVPRIDEFTERNLK